MSSITPCFPQRKYLFFGAAFTMFTLTAMLNVSPTLTHIGLSLMLIIYILFSVFVGGNIKDAFTAGMRHHPSKRDAGTFAAGSILVSMVGGVLSAISGMLFLFKRGNEAAKDELFIKFRNVFVAMVGTMGVASVNVMYTANTVSNLVLQYSSEFASGEAMEYIKPIMAIVSATLMFIVIHILVNTPTTEVNENTTDKNTIKHKAKRVTDFRQSFYNLVGVLSGLFVAVVFNGFFPSTLDGLSLNVQGLVELLIQPLVFLAIAFMGLSIHRFNEIPDVKHLFSNITPNLYASFVAFASLTTTLLASMVLKTQAMKMVVPPIVKYGMPLVTLGGTGYLVYIASKLLQQANYVKVQ